MHKNLIERVVALLKQPRLEWPVIAAEPATISEIYKSYVLVLAAVPAVCTFIGSTMIGFGLGAFGTYRLSFASGLSTAVLSYLLALVAVYVIALIIEALAPNFGAEKNRIQAFKTAAYAMTAAWVAGIGAIVPALSWLLALAGAVYSVYLLWLAMPVTMKAPQEKAAGYTAVTIVVAIVVNIAITAITGRALGGGGLFASTPLATSRSGAFDRDSPLGALEQWGKNVEAAGKQLDQAQKKGDQAAQGQAIGAVMAAALGGKSAQALEPERMKSFLPETLDGMPRTSVSSQRDAAFGLQVSKAQARYGDGSRNLRLEITDSGGVAGLMALASWAQLENETEDGNGYERTRNVDGRVVHEEWRNSGSGQFATVVGKRFVVAVEGEVPNPDVLRKAIAEVNLGGLESLRNEGGRAIGAEVTPSTCTTQKSSLQ